MTFSEQIAGPKISVKSADGADIQGSTAIDSTEKVATFTPKQSLRPGTKYTVDVSEAIDSWENVMKPYSWSFTTLKQASGQWTFDEGNGRTAADSSGNDHHASLNGTAAWCWEGRERDLQHAGAGRCLSSGGQAGQSHRGCRRDDRDQHHLRPA
ncbi:Ig-like domain-containing protein [Nonomuraea polychroma]|uniref:Ig-like domain-containing protein n=1 Tax=Nonomuraea polychroma TaxID=46176 RepID=UPI000FDF26DE|nr:Ig-like domain-containing protein [Nonomuraea polychroma]